MALSQSVQDFDFDPIYIENVSEADILEASDFALSDLSDFEISELEAALKTMGNTSDFY